uniref:Complex 1 LYR protein n=1 Tax=Tetraselmis sp. GSL018 TaxID=582737 RepID=A0A061QMR8_9CHLO
MKERALLSTSAVLRDYREVLKLISYLPENQQREHREEIRQEIKSNKDVSDPGTALDRHRKLVAKLSYLRMITPRQAHKSTSSSAGTYVLRQGDLLEGAAESKGRRVADGVLSMEEARAYHHRLLKRQYFGREPPNTRKFF